MASSEFGSASVMIRIALPLFDLPTAAAASRLDSWRFTSRAMIKAVPGEGQHIETCRSPPPRVALPEASAKSAALGGGAMRICTG